jgi:hypothetical protein
MKIIGKKRLKGKKGCKKCWASGKSVRKKKGVETL